MVGGESGPPQGQIVYEGPIASVNSSFSFVVPEGVTSISVVAVSAGCSVGDGGNLAYGNNIAVTPGETLTVIAAGSSQFSGGVSASQISRGGTILLRASANRGSNSGTNLSGGGIGGGYSSGGGGAGGYTGNGGDAWGTQPTAGGGGAGAGSPSTTGGGQSGGGGYYYMWEGGYGGGGGVGLLGLGPTGVNGPSPLIGGGGGSYGTSGGNASTGGQNAGGNGGNGGNYGGGGGAEGYYETTQWGELIDTGLGVYGRGARGAVRIIWPGNTRQFPSTNTGNV